MSLSKSKYWYSNNCLEFLKRAVPLPECKLKNQHFKFDLTKKISKHLNNMIFCENILDNSS